MQEFMPGRRESREKSYSSGCNEKENICKKVLPF